MISRLSRFSASGATTKRPAFQRLLGLVEAGQVDAIVVARLCRLTRAAGDLYRLLEMFQQHDVSLASVTESFCSDSPAGRMMISLLGSLGQYERELVSERVRARNQEARRQGRFGGGRAPTGYRLEGGQLAVVSEEAEVVRAAFAEYIACGSAAKTAEALNEQGLLAKGATLWTKPKAITLIKSATPAGLVIADGDLVDGIHDAIISREVWDEANRILAGHATKQKAHAGRRSSCSGGWPAARSAAGRTRRPAAGGGTGRGTAATAAPGTRGPEMVGAVAEPAPSVRRRWKTTWFREFATRSPGRGWPTTSPPS